MAAQSPLEAALLDVRSTLADLLVAADEQYAAVAAGDRDRLEAVTRQQERLSARLARAEATRIALLAGMPLSAAVSSLPAAQAARASALTDAIGAAVNDLKERQARTTSMLEHSVRLTGQTLNFLQRLLTSPNPAYSMQGISAPRQSVLVDGRA